MRSSSFLPESKNRSTGGSKLSLSVDVSMCVVVCLILGVLNLCLTVVGIGSSNIKGDLLVFLKCVDRNTVILLFYSNL